MRYIDMGRISLPNLHATEEAIAKSKVPTLMLWIAHPDTINLGYFQSVSKEVDIKEAKRLGLTITRRPSGGGAALFDDKELYYSIVAGWDSGILPKDAKACFKKAADGIIFALKHFGIEGKFAGKNDVQVNGRKISGNAQTNKEQSKIQHGTFLVDFDIEVAGRVLKIPIEKVEDKGINVRTMPGMISERITTLNRELNRKVPKEEAKDALRGGFEKALGVNLTSGELTESEKAMIEKLVLKYEDQKWIYKR
ncbi:MAG: biotin/lipoate A/B protein ligase family protein [Candidatus Hydrothermarchaeaceae archaeon]